MAIKNTRTLHRVQDYRRAHKPLDGFSSVDKYMNSHSLIAHLDKANSNEHVHNSKTSVIRDLLRPQRGDYVLDVGCGVGHDTQAIARLIGHKGHVVGLDISKTMIRTAKIRSRYQKLSLEFTTGDAHNLKFPTEHFNCALVASTFMHLTYPQKALEEIIRVMKPGGHLVALEPDWDTIVLATSNCQIDRALVKLIRRSVSHSGIAHRLPIYFRQAGLSHISAHAATLLLTDYSIANDAWRIEANLTHAHMKGLISSSRTQLFFNHLKSSNNTGMFWGSYTGFAIVGTKALSDSKRSPGARNG